jgi:methylenetetrahydrofolate reductase (NADPH)
MHLGQIYQANPFALSYELFPPKTKDGREALQTHLQRLLEFHPHFITCTYGAGGSAQSKTLDTLALVRELTDIPLASHLTCVGQTRADIEAYLALAESKGIENIVAIRGDAPKDEEEFIAADENLRYGCDLVRLIRETHPDFGIAVGGYPETHPEAISPEDDLDRLKYKVDQGADVVITQLFYDNEDFYRWRDKSAAAGITVPIVPGVLPVTSYKQIARIASLCGARLPSAFRDALEDCGDDVDNQFEAGVAQAIRQVADLVENDVPGIHFYVLNKSAATTRVLEAVPLPVG